LVVNENTHFFFAFCFSLFLLFYIILVNFKMRKEFYEHAKKQNEIQSSVNLPEFLQKVHIESYHKGWMDDIIDQQAVSNTNIEAEIPIVSIDGKTRQKLIDLLAFSDWVFEDYFFWV